VTNDRQNRQTALARGIALFNSREFFGAHEVWEDWWRETIHPERQIIQGMIQTAVAMHHCSTGNCDGGRSVMERALRNLEGSDEDFHGVDMMRLREDLRQVIQQLAEGSTVAAFQIVLR
jgi:predicted metal-dependent hydrolase